MTESMYPQGVRLFQRKSRSLRGAGSRLLTTLRTIMPRGGHFAALEEPELLTNDIRMFFRVVR